MFFFFFFNHPAPPEIYTLSLHDALPICSIKDAPTVIEAIRSSVSKAGIKARESAIAISGRELIIKKDRKSTRLNSSHTVISYAVFCLKKKKNKQKIIKID